MKTDSQVHHTHKHTNVQKIMRLAPHKGECTPRLGERFIAGGALARTRTFDTRIVILRYDVEGRGLH